jgi:hypothetical protein
MELAAREGLELDRPESGRWSRPRAVRSVAVWPMGLVYAQRNNGPTRQLSAPLSPPSPRLCVVKE